MTANSEYENRIIVKMIIREFAVDWAECCEFITALWIMINQELCGHYIGVHPLNWSMHTDIRLMWYMCSSCCSTKGLLCMWNVHALTFLFIFFNSWLVLMQITKSLEHVPDSLTISLPLTQFIKECSCNSRRSYMRPISSPYSRW